MSGFIYIISARAALVNWEVVFVLNFCACDCALDALLSDGNGETGILKSNISLLGTGSQYCIACQLEAGVTYTKRSIKVSFNPQIRICQSKQISGAMWPAIPVGEWEGCKVATSHIRQGLSLFFSLYWSQHLYFSRPKHFRVILLPLQPGLSNSILELL